MFADQAAFDVCCEWGVRGIHALAASSDVVVIVDVLSFATCVDVAVARGARVFPYPWPDERAAAFAASVRAEVARPRAAGGDGYSLSPRSLLNVPSGTRLVLPSPNGSTLSLAVRSTPVLAGCLRNARAVAVAAGRLGSKIAVIPAGERWPEDWSLRPAIEDWIGAGAIISYLTGTRSAEAAGAVATFQAARPRLAENLAQCSSGREVIERGFAEDVGLAAQLNVSDAVPILIDGAYRNLPDKPAHPLLQH